MKTSAPTTTELDYLLKAKNTPFEDQYLFSASNKSTLQNVGPQVHLRAIIEFSNRCELDCYYCGIRKSNQEVERFKLDKDEVLEIVDRILADNYPGLLL